MTKNLLVKFEIDCGRLGEIESLFITTEEGLNKLINQKMRFYEVLGKHSQIEHYSQTQDFTVMSTDQEQILNMANIFGSHISGVDLEEYIEHEY